MRLQRSVLPVMVTAFWLPAGCGDNLAASPDAGDVAPPDAPGPTPDAAPPSCDVPWRDIQLGTTRDDQLWGMTTDRNHYLYVSGFEDGIAGVTNIEPDGNSRGVVLQIDTTGTVRWKAVLDTSATDTVEDLEIEAATGRVYSVGRTSGPFEGFTNLGQFDGFLAALSPAGELTTIFQFGDQRPQHPARLSLGVGREIAVAGYDDTYIPTNYVVAEEAGFVASFGRGGPLATELTQNYVQKVPLTAPNRIHDVVVDPDGSGSMYITSSVTAGPRASVGTFVKKLSRDGSEVWSTRISSLSVDVATAVGLSPTNQLFVTGATFQQLGSQSWGQQDAFVLKLDKATGAIAWVTQAGSAASDTPTSLAFDESGHIYIAGGTLGEIATGVPNRGETDIFAMKFDESGELISTWQTGTAEHDLVTSMAVNCGRVFVGGYSKGALSSYGPPTGQDWFVLQAAL